MRYALAVALVLPVALLAEGVDRNNSGIAQNRKEDAVALLAEGVDRNLTLSLLLTAAGVALLAEGVDRNFFALLTI